MKHNGIVLLVAVLIAGLISCTPQPQPKVPRAPQAQAPDTGPGPSREGDIFTQRDDEDHDPQEPDPDPDPNPNPDPNQVVLAHRQLVRRPNGEIHAYLFGRLVYMPTWDAINALGLTGSVTQLTEAQITPYLANRRIPNSGSPTPGSWLFPADNVKWVPVEGLPDAVQYRVEVTRPGFDRKIVAVTELQGWYSGDNSDGCNTAEEWGADRAGLLVLDVAWALDRGIDLHKIIKVGNIVLKNETSNPRAAVSDLKIKVEINGTNPGPGRNPKWWRPQDWTFELQNPPGTYTCTKIDPQRGQRYSMIFPWDPRWPHGDNQYVRITGSLVADHPHSYQSIGCPDFLCTPGAFDALQTWDGTDWWDFFSRPENHRNNPARWTEVHPPDRIELYPAGYPAGDGVGAKAVAVVADNGAVFGDTTTLDHWFDPPPRPTSRPFTRLEIQEIVGPETVWSSIVPDPEKTTNTAARITINSTNTRVNIRIAVKGQGGWGAPGKFKAIYVMRWV
jgi:hypothetical protein